MTGPLHFSRRSFLLAAGLGPTLLRAQDASPQADFSTDVNVVSVFATVRRKGGEIVSNLTRDDFQLAEDSRPQAIKYFSRESNLPLTLGLLVDTSMSQRRLIAEERDASYRFFDRVLREDRDVAFVIHFDFDTELLQDLTSSKKQLQKALDMLELPQRQNQQNAGGGYPGGGGGRYPGRGGGGYPGGGNPGGGGRGRNGGTVLYDAILLASDEMMRKQKGRKALVVLTDGVDTGSKVPLSQCIEAAQRADTLVYSVLFEDKESYQTAMPRMGGIGTGGIGMGGGRRGMGGRGGGPGRYPSQSRPDGKKVLQQISRETGGGFFEVSKKLTIEQIYERIQEELRNQYSLGYVSDQRGSGSMFRKIVLTTRQKDLIVQTREGYYPESH